jgi:hypothetical protein
MSWTGVSKRVPGDVIIIDDHNLLIDALDGLYGYVDVAGRVQPFQVDKPSLLVILAEGTGIIGFPVAVHVFLSSDNIVYEEIAACDLPYDGYEHIVSVTVPIPRNYYVKWTAPYGFIKSAILF